MDDRKASMSLRRLGKSNHFSRRDAIKSLATILGMGILSSKAISSAMKSPAKGVKIDKRDALFALLEGRLQGYVPAAFFIHFGNEYSFGKAAIDKHLEYFRYTDMDFIKVQYEEIFPFMSEIRKPEDWKKMVLYQKDFYARQLEVVKGLVKAGKREAPIIVTLYSPFMCAGHTVGDDVITSHLKEDAESVRRGMEIITESVMIFAKECIRLGVDGFLACTQGAEKGRFADTMIFDRYIKPYDLIIMNEIDRACPFNILHICDYHGDYDDLSPFLDYPGHVVNCSLKLGDTMLTPKDMYNLFQRPFMGGVDKDGVIYQGDQQSIQHYIGEILDERPQRFILGAQCTVAANIDWSNLREAIAVAHSL